MTSSEAETLLEFPCRFPIKAMGRNGNDFESVVTGIVFRHAELYVGEEVRVRPSAEGNFLSVTVTIEALSRDQLDRIYQDLTDCEQILMAL
jgi:putative lipoic acid-binding regulatory protein